MPLDKTRSNWLHDKSEAVANGGMVTSRHPLSAEAGLEILRAGGNAVDAAIAASFAESVVQPAASTIGGGGLFTVRTREGSAHGINYMWQAPLRASADMFPIEGTPARGLFGWSGVKDAANEIGGLAAAIPGSVAGLTTALERYGRLPLADVMKPAIRLARDGFPMDWYGSLMAGIHLDIIKRFPTTARMLLRNGEYPYRPNMIGKADLHRQPELAATLSAIAEGGSRAFYAGEIAESIVRAVNDAGGVFSLEDFSQYEAVVADSLEISYRGHKVRGDGGGFLIYAQLLNVLSHFDLSRYAQESAQYLHVLIEVFRHCLADRNNVGVDHRQSEGEWRKLLSAEYAESLARQIDSTRRTDIPSVLRASRAPTGGDTRTVHLAAIDGEGCMASLTETVIGNYGCFVMSETGVLMNNGMISFAPVPGYLTSIFPGARPAASFISPLHITHPDGKAIATVGSSGGIKIMTSVIQIALNIMDRGMSPQQAISQPRIDFEGDKVILDGRFEQQVIDTLRSYGHTVEVRSEELSTFEFGNPAVLARDGNGVIRGGVNPYQATVAAGYDVA